MPQRPVFRGSYTSPQDGSDNSGRRPVIFDILGPDWEKSILPDGMRLVLHVNPTTMSIQHNRQVERIQTRGGFVEQHWGDSTSEISFDMATGGFMRLYTGLVSTTNPAYGGTRRETIAYDKYLDLLALFHSNGSVYDSKGDIILQGIIKITYDEGVYLGWFNNFSVSESAEKAYQFNLSAAFTVHREIANWRSAYTVQNGVPALLVEQQAFSQTPVLLGGTDG
jgi:hypothetical protein